MASIILRNGPIFDANSIFELVTKNYIVRTYADEKNDVSSALSGINF